LSSWLQDDDMAVNNVNEDIDLTDTYYDVVNEDGDDDA
jgi:hypothetical protein